MLPPDVGCFRANALMASNQAVDSSKVKSLSRRGRRKRPRPWGCVHAPPPRHSPGGRARPAPEEVSSPAPSPGMGIDTTGPWGHGCGPAPALSSPTKPPRLHVGLRGCPKGDPRRGSIRRRRRGHGDTTVPRASKTLSCHARSRAHVRLRPPWSIPSPRSPGRSGPHGQPARPHSSQHSPGVTLWGHAGPVGPPGAGA